MIKSKVHNTSSTSAMAQLFGLTGRAIRLYEDRGLIAPGRDVANHRVFSITTRQRLEFIAEMRAAGVGLSAIRKILDEYDARRPAADYFSCAEEFLARRQQELREQSEIVGNALAKARRLSMAYPRAVRAT